jgi:hypothetical protein
MAGNETHPLGICDTGYTGTVCGDCADNYSKSGTYTCSECPSRIKNIIELTFILLAVVLYVAYLTRSTMRSASKLKPVYNVYLKIITNHFQILSAITNIDYSWPS